MWYKNNDNRSVNNNVEFNALDKNITLEIF